MIRPAVKYKKYICPIIIGLLALLLGLERCDRSELKQATVFVLDTIQRIDTIPMIVYKSDTITELVTETKKIIRPVLIPDTIINKVFITDTNYLDTAFVYRDTIETDKTFLDYSIVTTGKLLSFYPEIQLKTLPGELRREIIEVDRSKDFVIIPQVGFYFDGGRPKRSMGVGLGYKKLYVSYHRVPNIGGLAHIGTRIRL